MKKIVSMLCVCSLLAVCLCACGEKSTGDVESNNPPASTSEDSRGSSRGGTTDSVEQESKRPVESASPADEPTEDAGQSEVVSAGDVQYEIKWAGFSRIGDAENNEWLFRAIVQNTGDVPMFCNTCAADVETESGELVGKMEFMNFEP